MLLSLAIYLEIRFATFGYDSKFLFTEDYSANLADEEVADDPAPLAACAAYSKKVTNFVFQCGRFIALAASTAFNRALDRINRASYYIIITMARRNGTASNG